VCRQFAVLGKHSGRHALSLRYAELGFELTQSGTRCSLRAVYGLADRKKRIYDQDLISLLSDKAWWSARKSFGLGLSLYLRS
jgi:2-isopropylmalate synthase